MENAMIYMFPMHDTFYRQLRFAQKKTLKPQDEEGDWSWPQGKTADSRRMIEDIPGTVPEVRISENIL